MKKFIRHFVSFFLVAVMIVSSNITAFAANEKPVDSRFLPEITYTEDNNIEDDNIEDDIKNTFDFFLHHNIKVKKFKKEKNSKKIIYTLILPKNLNRIKAISELTKFSNISEIQNF